MANPTELYLPLLTHADPAVRSQASLLLLATYGARGLTYLRRMLDDPDPNQRDLARAALIAVGETSGLHVELQPFRGVYVRCLGDLQVFIDSHEVHPAEWGQVEGGRAGGRKAQGIFAYLVHAGRQGASRAQIADAIWDGPVSPSSISRTLSALRQMFAALGSPQLAEQILSLGREHCALNAALYHSDVDLFERTFDLATQSEESVGLPAAIPLYHQVLALYDGPYMEGVPSAQDWAEERRALITGSLVIAGERLAEHSFSQSNDRLCLRYCRQTLAVDPAADDVTVWLLRASERLGLANEVDRSYRRYLAAAGIDPARQPDDPVVQAYQQLRPRA